MLVKATVTGVNAEEHTATIQIDGNPKGSDVTVKLCECCEPQLEVGKHVQLDWRKESC